MKQSTWISELEVMRGVATVAVVAIHCTGSLWWISLMEEPNALALTTTLVWSFAQFSVPIFVIVSGASLSVRYSRNYSKLDFYRKRIVAIVPPYLFFSAAYIILHTVILKDYDSEPAKILFRILTASASYHLWFVALIIELYALYPVIVLFADIGERRPKLIAVGSLLLLPFSFIMNWVSFEIIERFATDSNLKTALEIMVDRVQFLAYTPFFLGGIYLGRNIDHVRSMCDRMDTKDRFIIFMISLFLCLVDSLLWINNIYNYFSISPLLFHSITYHLHFIKVLILIIIVIDFSRYLTKYGGYFRTFLETLGKHSFGIFLGHVMVIYLLAWAFKYVDLSGDSWSFYPAILFLTILITSFIIKVAAMMPGSVWIIGNTRAGSK